jgi:hypothetical protein
MLIADSLNTNPSISQDDHMILIEKGTASINIGSIAKPPF